VSRKRGALIAGVAVASSLVLIAGCFVLVIRSGWLRENVRQKMIGAIEMATGGRAELGAYRFDWKQLRIEVDDFVLHGAEAAGKPPLFRAASIAAGLHLVSFLRPDLDIQYLEVREPRVYLIVGSDGHTNVPAPKWRRKQSALETLLHVAIGRFRVQSGVFTVESRGQIPFDAKGRDLGATLFYAPAAARYGGDLAIQPLDIEWGGQAAPPINIQTSFALEQNRIHITSASAATAGARVEFSGTLENLVSPHGSFQYLATADLTETRRFLPVRGVERGTAQVAGNILWNGPTDYSITGNLHTSGIAVRQDLMGLRGLRLDGTIHADGKGVELTSIQLRGEGSYSGTAVPVEGRIKAASLYRGVADFRGLSLALLGGTFEGSGTVEANRVSLHGVIAGLEAKRAVAVYNTRQSLPWNSVLSGPITVAGDLQRKNDLKLAADLKLAPAPGGPAVRGEVAINYDARTGSLDVGASTVDLPSSRIEASGAIGRRLHVRVESRDLDDFLPVLGERAAAFPVKLERGSLSFDGTVSGNIENADLAGRLRLAHFRYSGESFDALEGELNATPQKLSLESAVLTRNSARAQFRAAIGTQDWQAEADSPVTAAGTVRDASIAELLALTHQEEVPATGIAAASGEVAGTLGSPQVAADVDILKASWKSQRVDRVSMHVRYAANTLEASSGQLAAGAAQVHFAGSWEATPGRPKNGRLRLQVESNAMPIDQTQFLGSAPSGIHGSLQVTASGAADFSGTGFHLRDLQAEISARKLQLGGRPLGDAHLEANSEGSLLRVRLDSDLANSMLRGQGEWRLEGDYPGRGSVNFSRLDLTQFQDWLAPTASRQPSQFSGFAEGELRIDGPALKPELMKTELRIANLEIGPSAGFEKGPSLVLRNSGPIVATINSSGMTIEAARLTGRSTDLTLSGRVVFDRKSPLDLRGNGRIDLALLHDFSGELTSSGTLTLDANLRGSLGSPQVSGRMDVQNANLAYADVPNGITNGNGLIIFGGDRATIQQLTAESGGGRVQFTGFAGYEGGQALFRLHANAQAVRVRYPQGFSTVADANLNFTGTSGNSTLSGTITIRRSAVNLGSDFSSMLAKSAEPARAPSARTGFLGNLNFDIDIHTTPDVQLESSLTKSLQADAALRLRGNAANPALVGRINLTQGEVVFLGTKYTINQGTVSFYNPAKIDPILDIDLQTKARGIDVTLTISGPIDKLKLTPRSDPPLQSSEIIALLATGRSPTSDPTLLTQAQQSDMAQPTQESSGSALLGQVLANPVSNRLQQFFGISRIRIDPTLPGIEYNPQARLTLEQQVTPDVTFTYITNVTSANPQVVSMEWAATKQWSIVAQREENGVVGFDLFLKKRFK
jgi:translocation and assembly module TamB